MSMNDFEQRRSGVYAPRDKTTPELKGHVFTEDSPLVPQSIKDGGLDALEAHLAAENERWRIVQECSFCGEGLIAEERVGHRMVHVTDQLRGIARDLALLTPEQRIEVFEVFDAGTGKILGFE
jgi:hypothetical protein